MPRQYVNPSSLLARLGTGLLRGYVMKTEQERRQKETEDERAFRMGEAEKQRQQGMDYLQKQYDLLGERDKTNQASEDASRDSAYRRQVGLAAANLGAITPEVIESLRGDVDDATLKLMESISGQSNKIRDEEAAAKKSGGSAKEPKSTDISTLKSDLAAGLGFEMAPEGIQQVAAFMDRYGVPPMQAVGAVFPDPTKIPKVSSSSGDSEKYLSDLRKNVLSNHAKEAGEIKALGFDIEDVIKRMVPTDDNPNGEQFDDAWRHERADAYSASISQQMGIDPAQPLPMQPVNDALKMMGLNPIPGADQRTLTDLVDELISRNVGARAGGKEGVKQLDVIMKVMTNAFAPKQPQQRTERSGLTKGALKFAAALTPGVTYNDFNKPQSLGVSPSFQNPSIQGNRKP